MPITSPSPFAGLMQGLARPGVQFVVAQAWFPALTGQQQDRLVGSVYTLRAAKGDPILKAGEEVKGWYAVLSGLVKLQSQLSHGRRQAYLGVPGGEWFGEGSVLKTEPRRYDVIALRDSELLCMPREVFEELYATNVAFCQALCQQMNMRLGQAMAAIESMRLRTPEQRVAIYLSPLFWHGSRRMNLSQEELGILAGLSRQTVNSVLNEFERQGLVSLEFGRIEIRDDAALMRLLQQPQNNLGPPRPPRGG